jgi:hypothetical protein
MAMAVFVAVAGLTLLSVIAHEQWLVMDEQELTEQRVVNVSPELMDLRAREDSILVSAALLDSASATYRIPIERAMELVELENGK